MEDAGDGAVEVRNVPDEHRYEISLDGVRVGLLDYRINGDVLVAYHTEVDPSYGGRGLGSTLVEGMLREARERGLRVSPLCSFVATYLVRHPEYAELADDSGVGGGGRS
jgi:predicted GNAT family acetyltransferase